MKVESLHLPLTRRYYTDASAGGVHVSYLFQSSVPHCLRSQPAFIRASSATIRRDAILGPVARTPRDWRFVDGESAARVERNEERQMEGGNPWTRQLVADRLGRPRVRFVRGPGRCAGR